MLGRMCWQIHHSLLLPAAFGPALVCIRCETYSLQNVELVRNLIRRRVCERAEVQQPDPGLFRSQMNRQKYQCEDTSGNLTASVKLPPLGGACGGVLPAFAPLV